MHARPEEFPEDHNSADTLSLFQPAALEDSLAKRTAPTELLEENRRYKEVIAKAEPHFAKYNLGFTSDRESARKRRDLVMRQLLNLSDGKHSPPEIGGRLDMPVRSLREAGAALFHSGLWALS
jgi:aminopeptidase-like protein